jgi:MoxR-like ATPase
METMVNTDQLPIWERGFFCDMPSYNEQWVEPLELIESWIVEIEKVIAGKRALIERVITACLCEGHVLLEDVPGVGKTTLVQALAGSIGSSFKRIQFTPDQLPSDITGISAFHPQSMEFIYRPGPIMANIVLADEINRASPKTQSALLEAMEERCVTVDGTTYPLPRPFLLLATQNPLRHEGTYALPEAQMDRFMFQLRVGYPLVDQEIQLMERARLSHPLEQVKVVITGDELIELQRMVRAVHVDSSIKRYIVNIVEATRNHPDIRLGASPRASIVLMRAAQARAWMQGREYVIPDDVKALASAIIKHRLVMKTDHFLDQRGREELLEAIIKQVSVPTFIKPIQTVSMEPSPIRKGWF